MSIPRGIANNNPGNVDRTSIKWQGMSAIQSDPRFITFIAPQWGFRCMARILRGDYAEGYQSVHALIDRWAPPVENNTSAYVTDVSNRMGCGIDDILVFPDQIMELLKAITWHENGQQPYSDQVIQLGIDLEASA